MWTSCHKKNKSNCTVTGDSNINLLKMNERKKIQEYFDICHKRAVPHSTNSVKFEQKHNNFDGTFVLQVHWWRKSVLFWNTYQ